MDLGNIRPRGMIARYFSRAVVLIRLRSGPIGPVLAERTVCVDGSAATL
jgi:hypothetical protein